jgi:hypothetical protein
VLKHLNATGLDAETAPAWNVTFVLKGTQFSGDSWGKLRVACSSRQGDEPQKHHKIQLVTCHIMHAKGADCAKGTRQANIALMPYFRLTGAAHISHHEAAESSLVTEQSAGRE